VSDPLWFDHRNTLLPGRCGPAERRFN